MHIITYSNQRNNQPKIFMITVGSSECEFLRKTIINGIRKDGRSLDAHRKIKISTQIKPTADGSALVEFEDGTKVLAAISTELVYTPKKKLSLTQLNRFLHFNDSVKADNSSKNIKKRN